MTPIYNQQNAYNFSYFIVYICNYGLSFWSSWRPISIQTPKKNVNIFCKIQPCVIQVFHLNETSLLYEHDVILTILYLMLSIQHSTTFLWHSMFVINSDLLGLKLLASDNQNCQVLRLKLFCLNMGVGKGEISKDWHLLWLV